jgi:hypothetical protein
MDNTILPAERNKVLSQMFHEIHGATIISSSYYSGQDNSLECCLKGKLSELNKSIIYEKTFPVPKNPVQNYVLQS